MYTLDTNAIIYYLGRDGHAVRLLDEIFDQRAPLYVSTITVVELFSRPLSNPEKDGIEELLDSLFVIPVDMELALSAGEIRRQHRLKTPDSVIAATALHTHTTLVTRNIQDFQKVDALPLCKI